MTYSAQQSQSGNVMIYILVAVALLAALTFSVAQSDRTTLSKLTDDKLKIYAAEIIDYGDTLKKATAQLRLRGTPVSALSFAHPDADAAYGTYDDNPDDEIFNPAGGAVIYKTPNALALLVAGNVFEFYGENEVNEVGSTCGTADCVDLMVALSGLRESVCIEINNQLNIGDKDDPPPQDSNLDITEYAGSFSYDNTIGDEVSSDNIRRQTAGCFRDSSTGEYVFYQVLVVR
jgi:hypothetical protein